MKKVLVAVTLAALLAQPAAAAPLPPIPHGPYAKAMSVSDWVAFKEVVRKVLEKLKGAGKAANPDEAACLEANTLLKRLIDMYGDSLFRLHKGEFADAYKAKQDRCPDATAKSLAVKLDAIDVEEDGTTALKALVATAGVAMAGWAAWVAANAWVLIPLAL